MLAMHHRMPRKRAKKRLFLSNWDDLRLFLEVAKVGSFTAAGATLGVDQATVSRRMASLEANLGAALFERTPQGSSLTVLGEKVQRHAQAMEAELHALVDAASGHEREIEGVVRLALTESIAVHAVIPRVLPGLHERYPKLTVRLSASYDVEELGHRQAELALRFFRPESGDLVAQRIVRMKTALVGHRRFRGVARAELPVIGAELGDRPTPESRYLERHLRRAPRLFVSSYVSQIEAVRAGIGVALLAKSVLALDPQLALLEPELPAPPELELWLVTPRSLRHVPRIATVWAALEEGLAFLGA
jgi:DNA-binding transcriptional LysR family regulator